MSSSAVTRSPSPKASKPSLCRLSESSMSSAPPSMRSWWARPISSRARAWVSAPPRSRNSAGLNAFFVRRDLLPAGLSERTAAEGWVEGRYDEAHDESGRRLKMSREDEHALVTGLPLVEVGEDGRPVTEPGA